MKHMQTNLFAIFLFMLLYACNTDDDCNCTGEIFGTWEVKEFMSIESRAYSKDDDYDPIIEFKKDGTINLKLEANSCFGDFELSGESIINFENTGCTKICCDSDFSNKFVEMLSQVGSYEIMSDKMKLNVPDWGWIELEYSSD